MKIRDFIGRIFGRSVGTPSVAAGVLFPPHLSDANYLDQYASSPWFRSVVRKIAQAVSITTWKLYVVKTKNGRKVLRRDFARMPFNLRNYHKASGYLKGELEEIKEHPLLDLLHEGNDFMSGHEILFITQVYLDILGHAYWRHDGGERPPTVIYPLVPTQVKRIPEPSDDPEKSDYYVVQMRKDSSFREERVHKSQIIMFREPDPRDPYGKGLGLGFSLGNELETDASAGAHIRAFFNNGGWPNLLVSIKNASPEECRRLEQIWNQQYGGVDGRFRAAFTNREMNVSNIGHTFKDLQLVDLRRFNRDLVLQFFGVPPEKFGQLTACYDEKTEVLTERGWMHWTDLTPEIALASPDPRSGRMKYVKPERLYVYDYDGIMHHWHNSAVDLFVTPNHRMLFRESADPVWRFLTSEQLAELPDNIPLSFRIAGEAYKTNMRPATSVTWNGRKYQSRDLQKMLEDALHNPPRFRELATTIVPKLGWRSQRDIVNKYVEANFLRTCNISGTKWTLARIDDRDLEDILQWMCANSGMGCFVDEIDGQRILHVSSSTTISFWKHIPLQMRLDEVPYNGKVYCAETENGTIVVRRNGRVAVSGNSNRSTIMMADLFWTKDVILPRTEFIRSILQNRLVPLFDEKLILDFESPVVQDKEHTLDVMRAMPGAFTINEWREEADKENLGEEGEKHIVRPGEMIVDTFKSADEEIDLEMVAKKLHELIERETSCKEEGED